MSNAEKLYCIITGGVLPGPSRIHRVEHTRPCMPPVKMDGNDKAMWLEIVPQLADVADELKRLQAKGQADGIAKLYPRSKQFRIMFEVLVGTKANLIAYQTARLEQTFKYVDDSEAHHAADNASVREFHEVGQALLNQTMDKATIVDGIATMGLMSVIDSVAKAYDDERKSFDDPPMREVAVIELPKEETTDGSV